MKISRIVDRVAFSLAMVALCLLLLMMVFITSNVTSRYVFNQPIQGDLEVVELTMLSVVMLGLAYIHVTKGHVSLGLVVDRLPRRVQAVFDIAAYVLATAYASVIVWQNIVQAQLLRHIGEHTVVLGIPLFPFYVLVVVGFFVLLLSFLVTLSNAIREAVRR